MGIKALRRADLPMFMDAWRRKLLTTLKEDPSRILGRRYPKLAASIPDTFPNLTIVNLYMHPLTSNFDDMDITPQLCFPDIAKLA